MANLLQKYLAEIKTDKFKILGTSNEKLSNAIYFVMNFCNWLYFNVFTNERLTLNNVE